MAERFVFNESGMRELTDSWEGTVGSTLRHRSERLVLLGKASAGKDTGKLVESISAEYSHTDSGLLEAKVGANPGGHTTGYGLFNHDGTRPHIILPRHAKALRFTIGGRVVYAKKVLHPGTRPTHFLTRWLRDLF